MIPWLKIEHGLARKTKTLSVAARLNICPHRVVGLLIELWELADRDGAECTADDGTQCAVRLHGMKAETLLDERYELPGLAAALVAVDWLRIEPDALVIPRWDRHNSETARKRAQEGRRQAAHRARGSTVTQVSRSHRDTSVTKSVQKREQNQNQRSDDDVSALPSAQLSEPAKGDDDAPHFTDAAAAADWFARHPGSRVITTALAARQLSPAVWAALPASAAARELAIGLGCDRSFAARLERLIQRDEADMETFLAVAARIGELRERPRKPGAYVRTSLRSAGVAI